MQTPPVRSGKRVIFLTLDDGYGCSDSAFFSDVQTDYASVLYSSSLLLVRGITRRTGARGISINGTGAWDLRAAYETWRTKESTLAI
jgi:error-prone DNA polymerase